jgi:hypothetical protein
MWRALALGVAACTFSPTASTSGDGGVVAPPDVSVPVQPCTIHATGTPTPVGVLGGTGGTAQPDLTCSSGELPIGFAFDLSSNDVAGTEPAIVAIHMRCGRISRDATNTWTRIASEVKSDDGNHFTCFGWGAGTGGELLCPTGEVLVGIKGNEAASSLYNSLAIECAPYTGGAVTTLPFPDTASFSNHPQHPVCGVGQAMTSFGVLSGCGQDELIVNCAAVACS